MTSLNGIHNEVKTHQKNTFFQNLTVPESDEDSSHAVYTECIETLETPNWQKNPARSLSPRPGVARNLRSFSRNWIHLPFGECCPRQIHILSSSLLTLFDGYYWPGRVVIPRLCGRLRPRSGFLLECTPRKVSVDHYKKRLITILNRIRKILTACN